MALIHFMAINTNPSPSNNNFSHNINMGGKAAIIADNYTFNAIYVAHNLYLDNGTWKTRQTGTTGNIVVAQDGTFYVYKGSSVSTGQTPTFTETFRVSNTLAGGAKFHSEEVLHSANSLGGVKLATITISDDATVEFSSTYITDTYDTYEVVLNDIIPATNDTNLKLRFGFAGVGINSSNYYRWYNGHKRVAYNKAASEAGSAYYSTSIALNDDDLNISLGNGTNEKATFHIRLHNLRKTASYKGVTHVNAFGFAQDGASSYGYEWLVGLYSGSVDTKVDTLQFFMNSGNITSGTATLYGIKTV